VTFTTHSSFGVVQVHIVPQVDTLVGLLCALSAPQEVEAKCAICTPAIEPMAATVYPCSTATTFTRLADTFLVQLVRVHFDRNRGLAIKNTDRVSIPLSFQERDVTGDASNMDTFELCGLVLHQGDACGGKCLVVLLLPVTSPR
jgi:hypothetical protein